MQRDTAIKNMMEDGTAQPKPYATMDDKGPAEIFVSQAMIVRLLKKEETSQGVCTYTKRSAKCFTGHTRNSKVVTWLVEAIYVTGEVGTVLVLIEINHKHKGQGKDPTLWNHTDHWAWRTRYYHWCRMLYTSERTHR